MRTSKRLAFLGMVMLGLYLFRTCGALDWLRESVERGRMKNVVLTDGDWCFAAVPQGEPGWFMDPASTYGYVGKTDLTLAGLSCQLDWME